MSDLPATPLTYQRDHQNSGQSLFFGGELRGYNVVASNSGGNCVDLEHSSNPYRFYGLVASGCNNGIGINMYKSRAAEFHGVSAPAFAEAKLRLRAGRFGNTIDVSLSGNTNTSALCAVRRGAVWPLHQGEHVSRPAQRAAHLRCQLLF